MKLNILTNIKTRSDFRNWLLINSEKEKDCYLLLKRGRPKDDNIFYYLDAVEEAICFGWIDSTLKNVDGILYQRFSKRTNNSSWTELNKERARRLIKLNLMTEIGYKSLPDLTIEDFVVDEKIIKELTKAHCYEQFLKFPPLYQRIRVGNLKACKNESDYNKSLDHLIRETKENKTYGQWNDYGRLIEY